ncbi:hypothetical protein [Streptococcus dentiloxodontae]
MLDYAKLNRLKKLGLVLAGIFLVVLGFGLGQIGQSEQSETETKASTTEETSDKTLTRETIEEFLVAYYTKKDLEENRSRYKPFMTDSLYNQQVSLEEEAQNQAYKGYVVDFEYQDATIYIDEENLVVLIQVKYTNTLLSEKDNYDDAQTDVVNEATLRLTYVEQDGDYLVNKMESIILTSNTEGTTSSADYGSLTTSDEE